jgi:hypothetical protein
VRAALDFHLTAVLRGRSTVAGFAVWWDRATTAGLLDVLTPDADRRGCKAVDLCRLALDDRRRARIGDEDVLDLLRLAREALSG